MMLATFDLHRTTPDGRVAVQPGYATKRAASIGASYVLYDNGAATKAEAQVVAAQIGRAPIGETLAAFGYSFRIVKVPA